MRPVQIIIFVSFLMTRITLAAVGPSDLLTTDSLSLTPRAGLKNSQVQRDIDELVYSLENGYGGRPYVGPIAFGELIRTLTAIPLAKKLSSRELCHAIESAFLKIPDARLTASLGDDDCGKQITHRVPNVGESVGVEKQKAWELNYLLSIPVVTLRRFPPANDPQWNGFETALQKIKESAPAIIVDLRGNSGGDDAMGLTLARILAGDEHPQVLEKRIESQTPTTIALRINAKRAAIAELVKNHQTVPDATKGELATEFLNFELAKAGKIPPEKTINYAPGKPFDAAKAYAKPIYLLTDAACAGSCESTVAAFEGDPFVKTIGERTAGALHFGNLGEVTLPYSAIKIVMATDYWKFRDGRFIENIGFSPNLPVPPGEDALSYAVNKFATGNDTLKKD